MLTCLISKRPAVVMFSGSAMVIFIISLSEGLYAFVPSGRCKVRDVSTSVLIGKELWNGAIPRCVERYGRE